MQLGKQAQGTSPGVEPDLLVRKARRAFSSSGWPRATSTKISSIRNGGDLDGGRGASHEMTCTSRLSRSSLAMPLGA